MCQLLSPAVWGASFGMQQHSHIAETSPLEAVLDTVKAGKHIVVAQVHSSMQLDYIVHKESTQCVTEQGKTVAEDTGTSYAESMDTPHSHPHVSLDRSLMQNIVADTGTAVHMQPLEPRHTPELLHTLDKHPWALFQAAEVPQGGVAHQAKVVDPQPPEEVVAARQQRSCFKSGCASLMQILEKQEYFANSRALGCDDTKFRQR